MARKPLPVFAVGDVVRFDPEIFAKNVARQKFTDPAQDAFMVADTFVVVQFHAANPTVAMRSQTTGNVIGGVRRALVKA